MSSALEAVLELVQMNDYATMVIVTAVTYDYLLTFSREIDYIWCRKWTWVSTLFVLVRYFGICYALVNGFGGSTFVPGPPITCVSRLWSWIILITAFQVLFEGAALYLAGTWSYPIFYGAADLIMILRVYAMWNQSKLILRVLLFIFIMEIIIMIVLGGIYNIPNKNLSVSIVQIAGFAFCGVSHVNPPARLAWLSVTPVLVLSTTLFVLVTARTLKQAFEMYKATKIWQPNRYIQQFVRDGIAYYIVVMFFNVVTTVQGTYSGNVNSTAMLFLYTYCYITLCPLMPRFIISIREMYDRDGRGRWREVDTGFGVVSQPNTSHSAVVSAIAFADTTLEGDQTTAGVDALVEEIRLDVRAIGDSDSQV